MPRVLTAEPHVDAARKLPGMLRGAELGANVATLCIMSVIPAAEIVARAGTGTGISGASMVLQHLVLWVAGLGAMLAAQKGELLALSTASFLPEDASSRVKWAVNTVAAVVSVALAWAALNFLLPMRDARADSVIVPGFPTWWALVIMPVSFVGIALRLAWTAWPSWHGRVASGVVTLAVSAAGFAWPDLVVRGKLPLALLLGAATVAGMPMFASLGGLAALFFHADGTPTASVAVEAYRLASNATYPALPLFTLAGYVLSAGGSSARLLRLFQAWFGWLRGGTALVTALACAFFTALTGASGVTILSLGGLLMPVLLRSGHSERFSLGLVTASGSIGALFPPALPILLYALSASVPVVDLFVACMVPGILLVLSVGAYGVLEGHRGGSVPPPFDPREAMASLWGARWVVLLPVVVLVGVFGGIMTLVDSASVTVLYALLIESLFHREPGFAGRLRDAVADCARLVGGVMLILGMALGFTNYMVDVEVPTRAVHWIQEHLHSRFAFLLAVNLVLVVVGAAMDIFSGILVMVPLLAPMAAAYGVDPLHMGAIFMVNLQLGYLVPPMGENLFLASYRFNQPILALFRASVPFVVIMVLVTLVVTYVPALVMVPLTWFHGGG